jgi:hypothetical protein
MEFRKFFVDNLEDKKRAEKTAGGWEPGSSSSMLAAANATEARVVAEELLKDFDAGKVKIPKDDSEKELKKHLVSIRREMKEEGERSLTAALRKKSLDALLKESKRRDQEFEIAIWMLGTKASEGKGLRR